MYALINQSAKTVVGTIPSVHVTEYEWLLQNLGKVSTPDYQNRYRLYWGMGAALLSSTFYTAYFAALNAAVSNAPTLSSVAQTLHAASTNSKGRRSLQFSFATKLLHMTNQQLPIYSSEVAAFYFFQEPEIKDSTDPNDLQRRIFALVTFHDFLKQEYARVLQKNLLVIAIQEFKRQLNPQHFTDEKIVDSLIWAFVAFLWNGALPNGQIVYQ
jgi:hypothetical protein